MSELGYTGGQDNNNNYSVMGYHGESYAGGLNGQASGTGQANAGAGGGGLVPNTACCHGNGGGGGGYGSAGGTGSIDGGDRTGSPSNGALAPAGATYGEQCVNQIIFWFWRRRWRFLLWY